MKDSHSFQEYVSNRFDNEFWAAAEKYLDENFASLNLTFSRLHKIGEAQIEDVKVEHVWTSNLPGMEIRFDVALDVDIVVPDADRHYDNEEEKHFWLMVSCYGDLALDLNDFRIDDISEYSRRVRREAPMDDALVPVISSDNLDAVAEEFLQKYYPEALRSPAYVDPNIVAERMGLKVKSVRITKDGSIFGRSYFCDADTELYDPKNDRMYIEHIEAGTILVDVTANFLRSFGSMYNTIIHECVHWYLHKKAFALARLYNKEFTNIGCKVIGGISGNKTEKSAVDWMEWQANALAPRIQMPLAMLRKRVEVLITEYRRDLKEYDLVDNIERIIETVSVEYLVSRTEAKIRLRDAGYAEAAGACIYLDGKYVRAHKWAKDAIEDNQTYSISARDAMILSLTNADLRTQLGSGRYLFVENHFVVRAPLYVETDEAGDLRLTNYARKHMDECCLPFRISLRGSVSRQYQSICFLNRDKPEAEEDAGSTDQPLDYYFEPKLGKGYDTKTRKDQLQILLKMEADEK